MMEDVKIYKKKLTNAGGGTRFLAFLALLFAGLGCALEPLAKIVYKLYKDTELDVLFSNDWVGYIEKCMPSITVAVVALVYFLVLLGSSKKMNVGSFETVLAVFTGIALIISPAYNIATLIGKNTFISQIKKGGVSGFTNICELLVFTLPALSAFFIILSGLALAGRLMEENIQVEIPLRSNVDLDAVNEVINRQPYTPADNGYSNVNDNTFAMPAAQPQNETANDNFIRPAEVKEETVTAVAETSPLIPDVSSEENSISENTEKTCPNCFAKLKSNAKFCASCGTKLD